MDRIVVACVRNPFDPLNSREILLLEPGSSVPEYVREFFPLAPPDMDVAVAINGRILAKEEQTAYILAPKDSLAFCAVPHGGGDGKNPIATVLMLAVVVASIIVAPYLTEPLVSLGLTATTAEAVMAATLMTVGGLIVNAVFPPSLPGLSPNVGNLGDSPTYSWEVQGNALAEGVALPVVYGEHRVTPPLIGRYVELEGDKEYLNLLYAVADHAVDGIFDEEVNDNPVTQYSSIPSQTRLGSLDQTVIQYFENTKTDIPVQVKLSTAWTQRTTQGNSLKGFGIGIVAPKGLYFADVEGLTGVTVKLHIEYRPVGGNWTRIQSLNTEPVTIPSDIEGRWSGGYWAPSYGPSPQWVEIEAGSTDRAAHLEGAAYKGYIDLPGLIDGRVRVVTEWRWLPKETTYEVGTYHYNYVEISGATQSAVRRIYPRDNLPVGQYEFQVRLESNPPTGPRYGSDIYWEYYQEVVYDDFTYPGTALLAMRALATDQLSGGMPRVTCMVKRDTVPVWTGQRYENKLASNPAWACYDILHNADYGGGVPVERIQLSDFQAWADWCTNKGYRVDIYLESTTSLRKALDTISLLGRGSVIQMGSRFTCIVDRDVKNPVQGFLFTMGNIVKDSYTEEFLPMSDRANGIEVTYFDKELKYSRQTVEIYADNFDTSPQEINKTQVTLFGETDRQRAMNYGRAMMNRNRYLTLTASWDADVDALACLPGDVVSVQHDVPQWGYGGRLVSAGPSWVNLDRKVTLYPGVNYAVTVKHSDDSRENVNVYGVTVPTETDTLDIVGNWEFGIPEEYDLYSFGEVNRVSKLMRILSITRGQDQRRKVTALEYVPEVYAENVVMPKPVQVSDLPRVANLLAREIWAIGPDGSGRSVIDLSWRGNAISWYVFLRRQNENWASLGQTLLPRFTVQGPLTAGQTYDVAVSPSQNIQEGIIETITVLGKLAPPSDVEHFLAWPKGDRVYFSWDHILDVDLWGYEIRRGQTWEQGLVVVEGVQENAAVWNPPLSGTYRFWIKAVDDSGIYSTNPVSSQIAVTVSDAINIVMENHEIPDEAASGEYENMVYLPAAERIVWIPGMTDTDFDANLGDTDIPDYEGDTEPGIYTSQKYDIGAVTDFALRMEAAYVAEADDATDLTYPDRTDLKYPNDTDLTMTSLSTYKPEYRYSEDDVSWTAWERWTGPVDCHGRYFQIRVSTELDSPGVYFAFTAIDNTADVPDKEVRWENRPVAGGGTNFTLDYLGIQIFVKYFVGVTVLGSGALYPVVNKHTVDASFDVKLFNNAGQSVPGNVDLIVRGF